MHIVSWNIQAAKGVDEVVCIYDHVQWQEGPHCRDYCFASPSVAHTVEAMQVDIDTGASDHQPFLVTLT